MRSLPQVFGLESFSEPGGAVFMHSEIRSTSETSRIAKPEQTLSTSNPETSNGSASIERILLRNDRVFAVFVLAGLLIAGLIVLAIFLRWDF